MRRTLFVATAIVAFLAAAELTCRIEDWIKTGVPLLHSPDHEYDLILRDSLGPRGKPNGHFKKWTLNRYGFRGPEISFEPDADRMRIMVLGASETFGYAEASGREFPAQLQIELDKAGDYEVINAAIVGMTVVSMRRHWENWSAQFQPRLVVIYPSPLLYLSDSPPARSQPQHVSPDSPPLPASRFVSRIKDRIDMPDVIQRYRDQRRIDASLAGKGKDWAYRSVPRERLDLFLGDIADLLDSIQSKHATPILVARAVRATTPPRAEDMADLRGAQANIPRATPEAMLAFEAAAARGIISLGEQRHVPVIDLATLMNGHREFFVDLVHLTEEGAGVVAKEIANRIVAMQPAKPSVKHSDR